MGSSLPANLWKLQLDAKPSILESRLRNLKKSEASKLDYVSKTLGSLVIFCQIVTRARREHQKTAKIEVV